MPKKGKKKKKSKEEIEAERLAKEEAERIAEVLIEAVLSCSCHHHKLYIRPVNIYSYTGTLPTVYLPLYPCVKKRVSFKKYFSSCGCDELL